MSRFDVKVCVVNANRVDFDRGIDWSILSPKATSSSSSISKSNDTKEDTNVIVYHDDLGINPTDEEIIERCNNGVEVN